MNKTKRFYFHISLWINLCFALFVQVSGNCELLINEGLFTCTFKDDPQLHIADTLSRLLGPLKYLSINSVNVFDVATILRAVTNLTQLERIILINAQTTKIDLSPFVMPMLTTLELTYNKMNSFTFPNNHQLKSVNLNNNNLEKWELSNRNLESLDLSHNNFSNFKMENNFINRLNLSSSFSDNITFVSIITTTKTLASELYDLSNNNFNNISSIKLSNPIAMLKLYNNKIFSLSSISSSLTSNVNIDLSQNPLQCSINLNDYWIILKLRNITFNEDLDCTFENSVNKYLISKYGWMFESETKVLDSIYNATLLQTYLNARNVKIWSEISSNILRIGWKMERFPIGKYFLTLSLNSQGKETYSKMIEMKKSENIDVVHDGKTFFATVCFLANIDKSVALGIENTNVSISCQSISNISKEGSSEIGYIVVIAILVLLLMVVMICVAIYFYKIKKSRSFQKISTQISQDIDKNNKQSTVVRNEIIVLPPVFTNDAFDPEIDNPLRRNTTRNLNESRISSNIYEIMESSNDNQNITNNDKTFREDITSNVYEIMDNSNNEIRSQNQDTYLTME